MCGILGAFSKSMYDVLYEASQQRGKFAYGHCFLTRDKNTPFHIQRFDKHPKVDDIKDVNINKLHLGHCQAPTSSIRKWKDSDAHPFVYDNWIVAHNGVLTNAEQLIEKYNLQVQSNVDTAVIPALLHMYEQQDQQTVVSCIKNTLSELKGTFGLWIVHKKSKQVFLGRQGSTIFANMSTGCFCSVPCKNKEWCELGEGCIYKIDVAEKNIVPIEKFTADSPFLFIAESEDT